MKSANIVPVQHLVTSEQRWRINGHRGGILWLTGLSASGKSTLALELERRLVLVERRAYVLDGDSIRGGLSSDLGFCAADRNENIRRVGEVAALFARAGIICITAFISPFHADRDRVRAAAPGLFHEIWVKADLEVCERRDPKGLYVKARDGEIPDFTGISSPYEEPKSPELIIETNRMSIEDCVDRLVTYAEETFSLRG